MHNNANMCAYLLNISKTLSRYHIILAARNSKLNAFKTLLNASPHDDFQEILHLIILHYASMLNNMPKEMKGETVKQFHDVMRVLIPHLSADHLGHQYKYLLGDFLTTTGVLPAMLRLPNINADVVFGTVDGRVNQASNSIFKSFVKNDNYKGMMAILHRFEGAIPPLNAFLQHVEFGTNKAFLSRAVTSLLIHHLREGILGTIEFINSDSRRLRFRLQYSLECLSGDRQLYEVNNITNYIDEHYAPQAKASFIMSCKNFLVYYNDRYFSKYIEPHILHYKHTELATMQQYMADVYTILLSLFAAHISQNIIEHLHCNETKFCNIKILDGKVELLEDKRGLAVLKQWVDQNTLSDLIIQ